MIRAFLFLLAVLSTLAHADYPASNVWTQNGYTCSTGTGVCLPSPEQASSTYCATTGKSPSNVIDYRPGQLLYYYQCSASGGYNSYAVMGCPNGGTLSGSTCIKSCPAGQVQGADGSCGCPSGQHLEGATCVPDDVCAPTKDKYTTGWVSYTGASVPTGTVCISGCNYQQNVLLGNDDRIGTDGRTWAEVGQTGLGTSCTGGTQGQTPDEKNKDSKKPPCGAADGVLTTSTGKVLCVPEGTPDARKPGVQKTESKQTGQNGEVTTTEKTTTKDPQTGATHTSTTSTTTNPDGTTKTSSEEKSTGGAAVGGGGTGDNSGNEPGQCAKEPDSPMCKKGTVKEKGQFDSAQGAKLQEAKDQLTAKFNEIKSAASAAFTASTASVSGTLPCPAPITVLGNPVSLCVSDYSSQLSVIGAIIVFAAGIIAILLVVTA